MQYVVIVRAVNYAGLTVEAFSSGFTVDFTPPIVNRVWIGDSTTNLVYQSDPTKMIVR